MKKFLSILTLLFVAVALPNKVMAYDYSSNTDPTAINLYLETQQKSCAMSYANSQWTVEFEAKNSTEEFTLNVINSGSDKWYAYTDGKVSANSTDWTVLYTNNQNGKFSFTDLTVGTTYKVTITGNGGDSCKIKIEASGSGTTKKVHMPLSKSDFDGNKKHYFLVGERYGEWHLQPEWEFEVVGNQLVLENRFMYTGDFAIAWVDNYDDYIIHKYNFKGAPEGTTGDYWVENENTVSLSSWTGTYEHAKGSTWTDPESVLYAHFAENVGGSNYWYEVGTFMTKIVCDLSSGIPTNFDVTIANPEATNANRYFSLLGSGVYNTNFCNGTGHGLTSMYNKSMYKGNGWQEGWIQYDPKTNTPYVDGNGEYLYHTCFTADYMKEHPVYFNQKLTDGEFSYTSGEVQFIEASKLSNLDSDPYKDFYNAFSTIESIDSSVEKSGNGYDFKVTTYNGDYEPSAAWHCYVVRDMWVTGEFKFWTGWGGNDDTTEGGTGKIATWHGENGGPDISTYSTQEVKAFDVTTGEEVILYRNGKNINSANYKVPSTDPVYYNRVILWYNVTDGIGDNTGAPGSGRSFIQFIQAQCGPAIFAQIANNTVDTSKNNYIKYNWYLNNTESNGDLKVNGYSIRRYRIEDGAQVFIGYPEGEYVDISSKGLTASDLSKTNAANQDFTTVIDGGIDGTSGFDPGVYQYDIVVTFADGTKEAVSNKVAIYGNQVVNPSAYALQLVKLDEEGKTAMGVSQEYMTYNPNVDGSWFALDVDATTGAPSNGVVVDGTKALNFLTNNQDKYVWTSNFYVRCLDNEVYTSTFEEYIHQGLVKDATMPTPTVKVTDGTVSSNAVQFTLGDNDYYSAVLMRKGNVATGVAKVTLSYKYTNANSEEVTESPTTSTQLIPVLPLEYNPTFSYSSTAQTEAVSGEYVTVDVPSQHYAGSIGTFNKPVTTTNVYVPVEEDGTVKTNVLTLTVDYNRPNVDSEILAKYNISHVAEADGYTFSFTDAGKDATANQIAVAGVSPYNDVAPEVKFTTTSYVNRSSNAIDAYGTFGNGINLEAPHTVTATVGTLSGMHIGKLVKNGKCDWMYKGHERFQDNNAVLVQQGLINEGTFSSEIAPYYYLYELSNGTDKATYEYLVPHTNCEGNSLVKGDVDDEAMGLVDDANDPLIAAYIAKGFTSETTPEVYVSSIYLYSVVKSASFMNLTDGVAKVKENITWDDMATGSCGDLPDTGTTQTAAALENHQAVFGLTYKATIDSNNVTGVEDVLAEDVDGEAVYYNLQGIRVDNPSAAGVYVRVQGKDVKKVVIK